MSDVILTPNNNGPYHVKGKVRIVTEGGREIACDGDEVWLCRCGQSANKPFCDGAH
jgi:CDGSH-type Zn-finger protein